jgi:hypothetical protein
VVVELRLRADIFVAEPLSRSHAETALGSKNRHWEIMTVSMPRVVYRRSVRTLTDSAPAGSASVPRSPKQTSRIATIRSAGPTSVRAPKSIRDPPFVTYGQEAEHFRSSPQGGHVQGSETVFLWPFASLPQAWLPTASAVEHGRNRRWGHSKSKVLHDEVNENADRCVFLKRCRCPPPCASRDLGKEPGGPVPGRSRHWGTQPLELRGRGNSLRDLVACIKFRHPQERFSNRASKPLLHGRRVDSLLTARGSVAARPLPASHRDHIFRRAAQKNAPL